MRSPRTAQLAKAIEVAQQRHVGVGRIVTLGFGLLELPVCLLGRGEQDPGLAARRLAIFGSQSPTSIAANGLEYARANGFPDSDIALMQELVTAMQAWSGIQ